MNSELKVSYEEFTNNYNTIKGVLDSIEKETKNNEMVRSNNKKKSEEHKLNLMLIEQQEKDLNELARQLEKLRNEKAKRELMKQTDLLQEQKKIQKEFEKKLKAINKDNREILIAIHKGRNKDKEYLKTSIQSVKNNIAILKGALNKNK